MKKKYLLILLIFFSTCNILAEPAKKIDSQTPEKIAKKYTNNLIKLLQNNQTKFKQDANILHTKLNNILSKVIAFKEISQAVMGKYAHSVSADESTDFYHKFSRSLIIYYGKILQSYDFEKFKIDTVSPPSDSQLKNYLDKRKISVPVAIQLKNKANNNTYNMEYSMFKVNDVWKIRNISIEGINLGIQFRNQFADAVKKYGSPQKVIKNWDNIITLTPQKAHKN